MDWSGTAVTCDGTFSLSSHHSSKGILDCLALGNVFQIYPIPTIFFFFWSFGPWGETSLAI